MDYERITLLEFQSKFLTDEACWEYLVDKHWPNGPVCNRCASRDFNLLENRHLFQCCRCHKQLSVTAGTMFHKTRTPLRKWFWAIYIMANSKKGVPMLYLQNVLGISQYRTAWLMGQKIRWAMLEREQLYSDPLEGTVQVDEIYIGGKQSKSDYFKNGSNKSHFLIAVQENSLGRPQYVRFTELKPHDDKDLITHITRMVRPGSLIKGDGANAYVQLPKLGYQLRSIPLRKKRLATENLIWVNTLTSNLKRFLLSTHHSVPVKYRNLYVNEFAYRFNRRHSPGKAFDMLLNACLKAHPKELAELNT